MSRLRRATISSAALFVKVTGQIRSGGGPNFSTRYRIRPIRQRVLPAPGPANTRTGPAGALTADHCCGKKDRSPRVVWATRLNSVFGVEARSRIPRANSPACAHLAIEAYLLG